MKSKHLVLYAVSILAMVCVAGVSRAESPFDGTWKTDITHAKWDPKPIIFYTSGGWYHCDSCNPVIAVAADGQDHAVTGQSYDTVAVTIVDPHTLSFTFKKDGKVTSESTRTVSADGKMLTVHTVAHPRDSDKAQTFDLKARRDGMSHPDVHATSGKWIVVEEKGSDEAETTTYKVDGDQISMSQPTGENYTATFGGGDAPYKGAYSFDSVSVKRLAPNKIEETDKRNGEVIDVYTMTVTGKTMTIVEEGKKSGRTTTLVAHKQ